MPALYAKPCKGNAGRRCVFSATVIGDPRAVYEPQSQCYFCDPSLQHDGDQALQPYIIGALAELFVLDVRVYTAALQTVRSVRETRHNVRHRLMSLNPARQQPGTAGQLRTMRAAIAVDALLHHTSRDAPAALRRLKAMGQVMVRLRPLQRRVRDQLFLICAFLVDVEYPHRLFQTCEELAKNSFTLSREPLFLIQPQACSDMERVLSCSYSAAREMHKPLLYKLAHRLHKFWHTADELGLTSVAAAALRAHAMLAHMLQAPALPRGRVICAPNFEPREMP